MYPVICSGVPLSIALNSGVAGAIFNWTAVLTAGSMTGFSSGPGSTISQTLINTGNSIGEVTYTINASFNGCTGPDKLVVITVNPKPVLSTIPGAAQSICSGSGTNIALSSNVAGSTYAWSGSLSSGNATGFTSGTVTPVSDILVNPGPVPATVTYTITPLYNGCSGDAILFPVTVNPLPLANAGLDKTINYGISTTLTGSASAGSPGYSYLWSPPAYIQGTNTTAAITTQLLTVNPSIFTFKVTDSKGCESMDQLSVTLNGSALMVDVSAMPQVICNTGASVQLNANASGGNSAVQLTYSWTSVPGTFTSSLQNPVANPAVSTIYTVLVDDGFNTATNFINVTVNPLPIIYTVTGGGEYCSGGTGKPVGLSNSQSGINYLLILNGVNIGNTAGLTGSAITFGNQTLAGTYTVHAINTITNCEQDMSGNAVIIINPLPLANAGFDKTINYGISTSLNGTASTGTPGYTYTWQPVSSITLPNTTASVTTKNLYVPTTFTFEVTDSKGCINNDQIQVFLNGSALSVSAAANPQVICNTGQNVLLSAVASGGNSAIISNWSWTSMPVGFTSALQNPIANPAVNTTYYVTLNDGFNIAGPAAVDVTVNPLPTAYNITGGGAYCAGDAGMTVGLDGSESGISYQLMQGINIMGAPVAGTGSAISFGLQAIAGAYTVIATNTLTLCVKTMAGSVMVIINPLPNQYVVTGGGNYPAGGPGVLVGLSGSQTGISYQLFINGVPSGPALNGTGNALSFGLQDFAGNYTVVGTNTVTSCFVTMSGSATVIINPLPLMFNVTGGGDRCAGTPGLPVGLSGSEAGVDYQLQYNAIAIGSLVHGTGSPLSFGLFIITGTYTVQGINSVTLAPNPMNGSAVITEHPLPTVFSIIPAGSHCSGTALGMNGSQTGINYTLLMNGTIPSGTLSGTGSALDFGPQLTDGIYTIRAEDVLTLCPVIMTGTSSITPLPLAFNLTPAGNNCGTVLLGMDGSQNGVTYELFKNGITTGITRSGNGTPVIFGVQTPGSYTVGAKVQATGCVNTMTGSIIISPAPVPNAGADATACAANSYTLSGQASHYLDYAWSTPGDGTFDDLHVLNTIYHPGTNDTTAHSVVLTLTVNGTAGCAGTSQTDQVKLSFDPVPVAIAGNDDHACAIGTIVLSGYARNYNSISWNSNGDGNFSNPGNLVSVYTPGPADAINGSATLTLKANGAKTCLDKNSSDALLLSIDPLPRVDAGLSAFNCLNKPAQLAGSSLHTNSVKWSSTGDGTFVNDQVLNAIYTPGPGDVNNGSVTLHLTGLGSATCTDIVVSDSMVLTIMELPTAFASYNQPNCANEMIQFLDLSHTLFGSISKWIWNYGDGTANDTINFPNDPNLQHLYAQSGVYYATLYITNSFTCQDSYVFPVNVIPNPFANYYFYGNCDGQLVQFVDASFANGPGNMIAWHWDFGDPGSGLNNTSDLKDAQHIFSDTGSYAVSLIAFNYNNCSDTMTKLVTIHARPSVDFVHSQVCLNSPATFGPTATVVNVPATGWLWEFGDGLTSIERNTIHQFNTPGIYTVTLTITDSLGCVNSMSHLITVNELPIAHFDAGVSNCSGTMVTFADHSNSSAGFIVRWIWDFGDGITQTVLHPGNPTVTHIFPIDGTYPVLLTVQSSDSCSNSELQQIIIKPGAVANFDYSSSICSNSPVTFTDLTQYNGGGSIVQWTWDFGDPASNAANHSGIQNPDHQFTTPGQYTVILQVSLADGCTSETQKVIVITPASGVDFIANHRCQESPVLFEPDASVVNIPAVQLWHWDFGDGVSSPLQNPQHVYANSGTYLVSLTIMDISGCSSFISRVVSIIPKPVAAFSVATPVCSQAATLFTDLSAAPLGYIMKWHWDFGDGMQKTVLSPASPDVSHLYSTYGNYNVVLTVTTADSCSNSISSAVSVKPNPLANFNFDKTCRNEAVQFNDLSQGGSGGLSQWAWNFGDPASGSNNISALQNASHVFTSAGIYTVRLTSFNTGGCSDTVAKQVTVHELPAVDFTSSPGCVNDSTHFISSASVSPGAVTTRVWDFGDGFSATNVNDPYHIYTTSGSFTVTLTVTDTAGCINIKSHTVPIVPPPTSFFQVSAQTCSNLPVLFTNLSATSGGTITSYTWDFGDGTIATINSPASGSTSHVYTVAGNFTAKLKIHTSLGCDAESTRNFTISASPLALFNFDNTCAGAAVTFTDLSQVNTGTSLVNWYWTFGDATSGTNNTSVLQNPLHIYSAAGTYTVVLQVENASGCPDTVTKTVTVQPKPNLDFNWASTCLATTTAFTTNTTVTNVPAVSTYDWDFGDGTAHNTTQQNPVHTYSVTGNFTVILVIVDTAGCTNTKSHVISITPQPNSLFSMTNACLGNSTHFTDQSFTSNGEAITGWHWDFGVTTATNDTSGLQNPSWSYALAGSYNVNLVVTSVGGCQDTMQSVVTLSGLPSADFSYMAAPCRNGSVYFQDSSFSQSSTIVEWYWEFAPGRYSSLKDPVYIFPASDSCYDVKLIITNADGCTSTIIKQVCVPAPFSFYFENSAVCLGAEMDFTSVLLGPISDSLVFLNWNFGEPESGIYNNSTERDPAHTYLQAGVYVVSLNATDKNNCESTVVREVSVSTLPEPAFSFSGGICDSMIVFHNLSVDKGAELQQFIWNYGDGHSDTLLYPSGSEAEHAYTAIGAYIVTLVCKNVNGCETAATDTVRHFPCLDPAFLAMDTLICPNYPLAFADSSASGGPIDSWTWDFGDGTIQSYTSYTNPVIHAYSLAGMYSVKLLISSSVTGKSVSDSIVSNILVNPGPTADFSSGKSCAGSEVLFSNASIANNLPIATYAWSFHDQPSGSDTSTLSSPGHIFLKPGLYDVSLVVLNTAGCRDTLTRAIQVHELPVARFESSLACAGYLTRFSNLTDSLLSPAFASYWSFNDNSGLLGNSGKNSPEFIFSTPGSYLIKLQVADSNGCIDTISRRIEAWTNPTSSFIYHENFNDVQGQLSFENGSTGALNYFWDFGNGESSTDEKPVVMYQNDGIYTISFISWNDKGCSDTISSEYTFLVKGLFVPNAFSPTNPNQEVRLFKPIGINLSEYRFEVYDRWGNLLWWSDKLDKAGKPSEGWDGTYNGVTALQGDYIWKARAVFKDGSTWDGRSMGNNDKLSKDSFGKFILIK